MCGFLYSNVRIFEHGQISERPAASPYGLGRMFSKNVLRRSWPKSFARQMEDAFFSHFTTIRKSDRPPLRKSDRPPLRKPDRPPLRKADRPPLAQPRPPSPPLPAPPAARLRRRSAAACVSVASVPSCVSERPSVGQLFERRSVGFSNVGRSDFRIVYSCERSAF